MFFGLILLFFAAWAVVTNAIEPLKRLKLEFFVLAAVFFMAGVSAWVFSWALFVKKQLEVPFSSLFLVGFAALPGAITPLQSGSDALRSIFLKKYFGLSVSSSLQSSFIVKGLKFSLIFLFSALLVALFLTGFVLSRQWFSARDYLASMVYFARYLSGEQNLLLLFFFSTGLFVVFSGAVLFLLPLQKGFSSKVAGFFSRLEKRHSLFSKPRVFFEKYPSFLAGTNFSDGLFVSGLVFFSLACEFAAMVFSFLSVGLLVSLPGLFVFFVLFSVLERTPVLPRGIGIAEVTGYYFLSFPFFPQGALSGESVAAMLLVYGVVRLGVPTLAGFCAWAFMSRKFSHAGFT